MKPVLALTMGDPAGIGAEIAIKALGDEQVFQNCTPVILGDGSVLQKAFSLAGCDKPLCPIADVRQAGRTGGIEYIDLGALAGKQWRYGQVSADCGRAAYAYIERAIALALDGQIDGVVTGPINKEALQLGGVRHAGHTEIFAALTGCKKYAMLLVTPQLRVIHVTTHVSMRDACSRITTKRVLDVIDLGWQALRDMGLENPRIAVAGLNPHSSENGLFGWEEEREILPAVKAAVAEGRQVEGPLPPDTVFVKALAGQYDLVVAMYHDQGHIPIKLCGFKMENGEFVSVSGVNCTLGLPIIRTSVDHGTAYDRAGKGMANHGSAVDALLLAAQLARGKKRMGTAP